MQHLTVKHLNLPHTKTNAFWNMNKLSESSPWYHFRCMKYKTKDSKSDKTMSPPLMLLLVSIDESCRAGVWCED